MYLTGYPDCHPVQAGGPWSGNATGDVAASAGLVAACQARSVGMVSGADPHGGDRTVPSRQRVGPARHPRLPARAHPDSYRRGGSWPRRPPDLL